MSKFFVDPSAISGSHIYIEDKNDLHHLTKVLRGKVGMKIDISDGQLLATIKSGTILRHYKLIDSFVLVNSVRGKLSLLDTKQMEIIKQYSKKIFDPANYPATLLRAELHKNQLIIHGGLDQSIDVNGWTAFQRVIDENLVLLQ